jgi:putative DNA primase/helicase
MLIPKSVQCRILAGLLSQKLPDGYTLEQLEHMYPAFDEPWQTYLGPLLDAMRMPAGVARSSFIIGNVDISSEHRQQVSREAARCSHIPPLEELALPEIQWAWEDWLPCGMLTLLGAMPSAGKSYVALDLAQRVIAGTSFPDGTPVRRPGPVIYMDAENLPQIHDQRARAWAMDRSQLYVMGPSEQRLMIDLGDEADQDRLLEWAWTVQPALIVVDSLSAITSRGENHVEDVRDIFCFLNRVASDYQCGLLIIHHLRKPGLQLPPPKVLTFHDLRGSSHITAMSRSIIGLHWVQTGPQPDLNAPRRMQVLKTNLCRYPAALGVSFRPMDDDPQVAEVIYGPAPVPYRESTQRMECATWLRELLQKHGPLPPVEVEARAGLAGYSRATLYRARRGLVDQVVNTQPHRHPDNCWALVDGKSEEEGAKR